MNLLIADDEAVIRRGLLSLDWKSIGINRCVFGCKWSRSERTFC